MTAAHDIASTRRRGGHTSAAQQPVLLRAHSVSAHMSRLHCNDTAATAVAAAAVVCRCMCA
jgi:hypothetical protein